MYTTLQTIISTMCKNVNSTRKNADTDTADIAVNGNGEYVTTLTVPTKGAASTDEAPKRVIDTRYLSEEHLEALRKQDPFLYYSIPTVRNAVPRRSNAAHATTTQRNPEPARSRRASRPSRVESSMVERKSCISFECHTDLLLEDFMDDAELFGNGDGANFDTGTLFDQLFLRHKRQQ